MLVRIFFICAFFLFLLKPDAIFAQSACCSVNGGEYACDYSTNKLYCRDGSISKECTCRQVSPTPSPSPTPIPSPFPTLPSCVPYSSYDENLKACKCNSGYIVKDKSCVTFAQYCWSTFGGNSAYDSSKNSCVCSSGYSWNSENNSCISLNQVCQNKLGGKSYYNSADNTCNCYKDYYIQNDECELVPSPAVNPTLASKVAISSAPQPSVTVTQKVNIVTPSPQSLDKEKDSTLIVKDGGKNYYVSENIIKTGFLKKIFISILNFINRII